MTNFEKVVEFHNKFGLPLASMPTLPSLEFFGFRLEAMREELGEFTEAFYNKDLPGIADSLVDLVYFAMGTAAKLGLPWEQLFDEVHQANMKKIRLEVSTDRDPSGKFDVVKPANWQGPDIDLVLHEAGWVELP